MCDYSKRFPCSRMAKVGDRLVSTRIGSARGFALAENRPMGVCLNPGTEIAFEHPVETFALLGRWYSRWINRGKPRSVALFRRVVKRGTRYDAVEYPDGHVDPVARLYEGQVAIVLQLPAQLQQRSQQATKRLRRGKRRLSKASDLVTPRDIVPVSSAEKIISVTTARGAP